MVRQCWLGVGWLVVAGMFVVDGLLVATNSLLLIFGNVGVLTITIMVVGFGQCVMKLVGVGLSCFHAFINLDECLHDMAFIEVIANLWWPAVFYVGPIASPLYG